MGGYNSSIFSKMFSERTLANYDYILKTVNRENAEKHAQEQFLNEYEQIIKEINSLTTELRTDATQIANVQKKGKNELKGKLFSIASRLEKSGKTLRAELTQLISTKPVNKPQLYEITQLLNSLMGIAVLPYEMHKDYLLNNQEFIKDSIYYVDLQDYIVNLYYQGKWNSTYSRDINDHNNIKRDKIVVSFLSHIRNATCHSGDNSMSILPLDDGTVIDHILFYDYYEGQEFAMDITVHELKELVSRISEFYGKTALGNFDKTEKIKETEKKVKSLLNRS